MASPAAPLRCSKASMPAPSFLAGIAIKLLLVCCFTAYFFYGFDYITAEHSVRFEKMYATWGIYYPRGDEIQVLVSIEKRLPGQLKSKDQKTPQLLTTPSKSLSLHFLL